MKLGKQTKALGGLATALVVGGAVLLLLVLLTPVEARDPAWTSIYETLFGLAGVVVAGAGITATLENEQVTRMRAAQDKERDRLEDELVKAHGAVWRETLDNQLLFHGVESATKMLSEARVSLSQLKLVAPKLAASYEEKLVAAAKAKEHERELKMWAQLDRKGYEWYEHNEEAKLDRHIEESGDHAAEAAEEEERYWEEFVQKMRDKYIGKGWTPPTDE